MQSLHGILESNRRRLFVGRARELAEADRLLASESPRRVLFLVGPGGLGKTTLLSEIEARARDSGSAVARLDARYFHAAPDRFSEAAQEIVAELDLARSQRPPLLIVDTFEHLTPVENWFYRAFLPQLNSSIRLVLAGRQPPGPRWRTDLAWIDLMQVLELASFDRAEAETYLARRDVDAAAWQTLWQISDGNPLILTLATDVCERLGAGALDQKIGQRELQDLMLAFVLEALSEEQTRALQATSVVQALSPELLRTLLPGDDSDVLYDWLQGLSFISTAERGLFPHDLVRDAVCADLRRRDPAWHEALIRRAEGYYAARLVPDAPVSAQETLGALSFLSRFGGAPSVLVDMVESNPVYGDAATGAELEIIRVLVAEQMGDAQRDLFDYWYRRFPGELVAIRNADQELAGFLLFVDFGELSEDETRCDPVVDRCRRLMEQRNLRRPRQASLCRFWLDCDAQLNASAVQGFVLHRVIGRAAVKGLAMCGVIQADDEITRAIANVAQHDIIPLDLALADGTPVLATLHDWSVESVPAWMVRANRGIRGLGADMPAPAVPEPDAFKRALKQALKHFTRPDRLRSNPLLSLFKSSAPGGREPVEVLRAEIVAASETLREVPRTARYYEVLLRSYIQPEPSQLAAADALNMAPSTYYRHLASAVDLLAHALRQKLIRQAAAGESFLG